MRVRQLQTSISLEITANPNRRHWARTLADTRVEIDGETFYVEEGFEYDGSSIMFLGLLTIGTPFMWPYSYSGAIHDGMYSGQIKDVEGKPVYFTAAQADEFYRQLTYACLIERRTKFRRWWKLRYGFRAWRCWFWIRLNSTVGRGRRTYMSLKFWRVLHPTGRVWAPRNPMEIEP